jgi:hypothetical protein
MINWETDKIMPTYIIESEMPGVGDLSAAELRAAAQHSVGILNEMGSDIQWVQSFVTTDKIYAIYAAANEKTALEYACQTGLPANRVVEVTAVIDPTTAGGD